MKKLSRVIIPPIRIYDSREKKNRCKFDAVFHLIILHRKRSVHDGTQKTQARSAHSGRAFHARTQPGESG